MKNPWDRFAAEDAEFYIITEDIDYTTEEGKKAFFDDGKKFAKQTLENAVSHLPGRRRALEIGCGVGRLAIPHGGYFEEIAAVDISSKMLEKLKINAADFGRNNIETFLPPESWDERSYDYVYSFLVFQHIEDFEVIKSYISRIASCLKANGIAQLQFDTRSQNLLYRVRNILPNFLLPRTQRRGIRRIRRKRKDLEEIFKKNNLKIIRNKFPDTEKNIFILKKRLEALNSLPI